MGENKMFHNEIARKYQKQIDAEELFIVDDKDGEWWILGFGRCINVDSENVAIYMRDKMLLTIRHQYDLKTKEEIENDKK